MVSQGRLPVRALRPAVPEGSFPSISALRQLRNSCSYVTGIEIASRNNVQENRGRWSRQLLQSSAVCPVFAEGALMP
jgi:hypothetical protein